MHKNDKLLYTLHIYSTYIYTENFNFFEPVDIEFCGNLYICLFIYSSVHTHF